MPFCVNCGHANLNQENLCRNCTLDPTVPELAMDRFLARVKLFPSDSKYEMEFEYPKEHLSLVISILIASFLGMILSTLSLGLLFLVLAGSLLMFRVQQITTKASLVKVEAQSFPQIHRLAKLAAYRLKNPLPDIFILQDPHPSAYTLGLFEEAWIVLHSSLIELLNPVELLSVIGHEIGHIKKRHTTWLLLASPVRQHRLPLISGLLTPVFNYWSIKAEYTADRAGLLAVKDLKTAALAQIKLALGRELAAEFDLDSFLDRIDREQEETISKITEPLLRTHPYIRNRLRQLKEFYTSKDFSEFAGVKHSEWKTDQGKVPRNALNPTEQTDSKTQT